MFFFYIKYFIAKHKFNFFVKQNSKSAHRYNGFMLINNIVEDKKKNRTWIIKIIFML